MRDIVAITIEVNAPPKEIIRGFFRSIDNSEGVLGKKGYIVKEVGDGVFTLEHDASPRHICRACVRGNVIYTNRARHYLTYFLQKDAVPFRVDTHPKVPKPIKRMLMGERRNKLRIVPDPSPGNG